MLKCTILFVICVYIVRKFLKSFNGKCFAKTCLVGKTAIVTGGNSGIGYQIAINLASRGCRVIIADVAHSEENRKKIMAETGNEEILYKKLDLGSLKSVRAFATDILLTEDRLDILMNNAGCAGFAGEYTDDGLLKVVQINYFGHFLLVHLLLDLLKKNPGSRIVFTSSIAAYFNAMSKPHDLNLPTSTFVDVFNISLEYANSKLAVTISAKILAKKLDKYGISCYSVHPGTVNSSLFITAYSTIKRKNPQTIIYFVVHLAAAYLFGKTLEESAQTSLHCALSNDIEKDSGKFFADCRPLWMPPLASKTAFCNELFKLSEDWVKLEANERIPS